MRYISYAALAATFLALSGERVPVQAATEITAQMAEPAIELLVIEARSCPMCRLFRDEIAPIYRATARSERAPLRFIDVAHTDPTTLKLSAPIDIIPTVVFMRDGVEVDRVVGYTGPEIFMKAVGHVMGDPP
jgi:hypothetical protein